MLNIQNISKSYGINTVLSGVSFVAGHGDKVAIVGLNGAGKSTLLNIIAGKLDYNDGEIDGADDSRLIPPTITEMRIPDNMTVSEIITNARPIAELEPKITDA